MRKILKIAGNELRALFCSPVAWFILVIFAVQSGMTFTDLFRSVLRQQFMGEPIEYSITTALLTGIFVSICSLVDDGIDEPGIW